MGFIHTTYEEAQLIEKSYEEYRKKRKNKKSNSTLAEVAQETYAIKEGVKELFGQKNFEQEQSDFAGLIQINDILTYGSADDILNLVNKLKNEQGIDFSWNFSWRKGLTFDCNYKDFSITSEIINAATAIDAFINKLPTSKDEYIQLFTYDELPKADSNAAMNFVKKNQNNKDENNKDIKPTPKEIFNTKDQQEKVKLFWDWYAKQPVEKMITENLKEAIRSNNEKDVNDFLGTINHQFNEELKTILTNQDEEKYNNWYNNLPQVIKDKGVIPEAFANIKTDDESIKTYQDTVYNALKSKINDIMRVDDRFTAFCEFYKQIPPRIRDQRINSNLRLDFIQQLPVIFSKDEIDSIKEFTGYHNYYLPKTNFWGDLWTGMKESGKNAVGNNSEHLDTKGAFANFKLIQAWNQGFLKRWKTEITSNKVQTCSDAIKQIDKEISETIKETIKTCKNQLNQRTTICKTLFNKLQITNISSTQKQEISNLIENKANQIDTDKIYFTKLDFALKCINTITENSDNTSLNDYILKTCLNATLTNENEKLKFDENTEKHLNQAFFINNFYKKTKDNPISKDNSNKLEKWFQDIYTQKESSDTTLNKLKTINTGLSGIKVFDDWAKKQNINKDIKNQIYNQIEEEYISSKNNDPKFLEQLNLGETLIDTLKEKGINKQQLNDEILKDCLQYKFTKIKDKNDNQTYIGTNESGTNESRIISIKTIKPNFLTKAGKKYIYYNNKDDGNGWIRLYEYETKDTKDTNKVSVPFIMTGNEILYKTTNNIPANIPADYNPNTNTLRKYQTRQERINNNTPTTTVEYLDIKLNDDGTKKEKPWWKFWGSPEWQELNDPERILDSMSSTTIDDLSLNTQEKENEKSTTSNKQNEQKSASIQTLKDNGQIVQPEVDNADQYISTQQLMKNKSERV